METELEAENHKRQCPNAKETANSSVPVFTGWLFELFLKTGVL
jgi:hypothetical protein